MFNYLQRIGKSLMVPVAVLPAAAILLGIGYWIDPNGWGGDNSIAAFFIKSGSSIIDNMPILFAVGVAFGMSKDQNGTSALTGLVAFLRGIVYYERVSRTELKSALYKEYSHTYLLA